MAKPLKPGSTAPFSGQYQQIGPRGGLGKEITSVKDTTLPPGPKGTTYKVVDKTDNKSGGRR
jgi:hypothetical protein